MNPPWEPIQDIPYLYGIHAHKSPSQDSVLIQMNLVHILHPVSLRYILILPSRIVPVSQVSFDQNSSPDRSDPNAVEQDTWLRHAFVRQNVLSGFVLCISTRSAGPRC
jgi:hypothetical protein